MEWLLWLLRGVIWGGGRKKEKKKEKKEKREKIGKREKKKDGNYE